jgi:hypothetical protein
MECCDRHDRTTMQLLREIGRDEVIASFLLAEWPLIRERQVPDERLRVT